MLLNNKLVCVLINFTLNVLSLSIDPKPEIEISDKTAALEAKCDSPIYCPGPILDKIQRASLFKDSKTFVDMPTSKPLDEVLANFQKLPINATKEELKAFVDTNFLEVGSELVEVKMPDFNPNPTFLAGISDPLIKGFANQVHNFWSNLVRKQDFSKLCKGCVSSMLSTKHDFVVPGGRFREFYYWDTYFSLRGLLLGDLVATSKSILLNFIDTINTYGFIPNGARIYFLNRSQPPLLASMVDVYYKKTKDIELLKSAVDALDLEYKYWIDNHSVVVPCPKSSPHYLRSCKLTRYYVNNTAPRPESYVEDFTTVELAPGLTSEQKEELYADLATGAETGWDYSTRWLSDLTSLSNATHEEVLRKLVTRQVLPVDLNSVMYKNEVLLSEMHLILADNLQSEGTKGMDKRQIHLRKAKFYEQQAQLRAELMHFILFDKVDKSFYDYDLTKQSLIKRFSTSNYWPYWTSALSKEFLEDSTNLIQPFNIVKELSNKYKGGIPATAIDSKLQWDLPNSWPPLELVLIEATENAAAKLKSSNPDASKNLEDLSFKLSSTLVNTIFCSWYQTGGSIPTLLPKLNVADTNEGHMFEKFNVTSVGRSGGGGEYQVQIGFGWTNGVLLTLINKFNNRLVAPDYKNICGSS